MTDTGTLATLGATTASYDAIGNITAKSDVGVYAYDGLAAGPHAVTRAGNIDYAYDLNGNMAASSFVDTAAAHRAFAWASFNKPTRMENSVTGAASEFAYGPSRARVKQTTLDGGTAWYDHDTQGNLTRVTTAAGDTIDLGYDPAGRLTRIANPNAVETSVLYDALTGRPSRIDTTQGGAPLLPLAYGFDTDGKISSIADNGGTRNFTYDPTQQLTGGGYASAPESYAHDPEGNRTASHLSVSYSHDTANRLRENAEACYDYDANGNLATKTARVGLYCTGAVTTYDWDVLNRLVRIDNPDGTYSAYRYDTQGRRIEKDVNGALTRYVYDGDAILLEFDGANALQARYTHGEEIDQPLAMTRGGQSYFYGVDHLGSVRLLTDAAGAVANRYDYDAFGNWEATSYETVANPFGYTARERDAESGLMFYRARYYDPKIGRFISEDPIGFSGGDTNVYRYVFNASFSRVDPYGNFGFTAEAMSYCAVGGYAGAMSGLMLSLFYESDIGEILLASGLGAAGGAAAGCTFGAGAITALTSAAEAAKAVGYAGKAAGIFGYIATVLGQVAYLS